MIRGGSSVRNESAPMPEQYICRDRGMIYFRKRGCPKVRIREP